MLTRDPREVERKKYGQPGARKTSNSLNVNIYRGFMNHIEIDELIKAGAHFGHPTSRWNPNFRPYLATKKNGIHIIDLKQTSKALTRAGKEVTRIIKDGGHILFVGTKKASKRCGTAGCRPLWDVLYC